MQQPPDDKRESTQPQSYTGRYARQRMTGPAQLTIDLRKFIIRGDYEGYPDSLPPLPNAATAGGSTPGKE